MRKSGFLLSLIGCGLFIIAGVVVWPFAEELFQEPVAYSMPSAAALVADAKVITPVAAQRDDDSAQKMETAEAFLATGKPRQALKIIRQYRQEMENDTPVGRKWMDLLIRSNMALGNTQQLTALYEYRPKAFDNNEKASLIVAEAFVAKGDTVEFGALRDEWRGREEHLQDWLMLDTDILIFAGKHYQAIKLLSGKQFKGKEDSPRLVRLALLHMKEDPRTAWDYFAAAHEKDPANPEIRIYRAKLLEMIGKPSNALGEYLSAVQIAPDNIHYRDQLAEYYLRHGQYQQALEIWKELLEKGAPDSIWVKALFWSRVVKPMDIGVEKMTIPDGKLKPFIEYMANLKPWEFWNEQQYDRLEKAQQYLDSQQATWWLKLLSSLKQNNDEEAWYLLQFYTFSDQSWDPELSLAIKQVLAYRKKGTLNLTKSGLGMTAPERATTQRKGSGKHPFFAQLNAIAGKGEGEDVPEDLQELLKSKSAFAAVLVAAGWNEAAVETLKARVIPDGFPSWVAVDFIQALQQLRGDRVAVEFALEQKQTPQVEVLAGEMLLSEGNLDAAYEKLNKHIYRNDDFGLKATRGLGLIAFQKGDLYRAKELIEGHSTLAKEPTGKEVLARIALAEGDILTANNLYESIAENSLEAKSYLAKKAFVEKDWTRARELTMELLKEYPNSALLQQNYHKIEQEQAQ